MISVLDDTDQRARVTAKPVRAQSTVPRGKWNMLRSVAGFGLICASLLSMAASSVAADGSGRVSCTISENGQPASGVVSIQRDGQEISHGSCGKELNVAPGTYTAALRLDGALDGPEQTQAVVVEAGALSKLKTDFVTGTLEIRIASLGKRAAGIAIIKRGGQQLGTLGSGVAAHVSAGTYRVIVRYRAQEKDLGDVTIAGGQHATLDAAFE
jgi:hypothetical protein